SDFLQVLRGTTDVNGKLESASSAGIYPVSDLINKIVTDIGSGYLEQSDIYNGLDSEDTTKALGAEQGKTLKDAINSNSESIATNATNISTNATNIANEILRAKGAETTNATDIAEKTDKVIPDTTNNLPILNASGNLEDSLLNLKDSINLLNYNTITDGYYVSNTSGNIAQSATKFLSDYIPIAENTYYRIINIVYPRIAFYDSSKTFISGLAAHTDGIFETPADSVYLRYSDSLTYKDISQLQKGISFIQFSTFGKKITEESTQFISKGLSVNAVDFVKTGKNLYDDSKKTEGYYVSNASGNLGVNSSWNVSEYIPITENTDYAESYGGYLAFYNSSYEFISGLGLYHDWRTFTSPADSAFIRVSVRVTDEEFQFEEGTVFSGYQKFGYEFTNPLVLGGYDKNVVAFLPDEICIAVGRTIEIYNKQVALCRNPDNFSFVWTCDVGYNMKRKWRYTGQTADIGEYAMICYIYQNDYLITQVSTTIKVVAGISTAKTVLPIGDSLTNEKPWLAEVRTLSSDNITFVGTRGTAPLNHEGRSGFTPTQYLAPTEYTFGGEGIQPFWDATEERFNWAYYKTTNSKDPDAVQIFLGTNGIAIDPTINARSIKQIVDYIRQDDSTIPIFVVFTLYRGDQNGIKTSGVWKYQEDLKVFNQMQELYNLMSEYTGLYFVPIALCHDSEYNFGAVSTAVNPRASQVEYLPTEATHPQEQGYLQMADIMYSTLSAHL
ncbi:MAG: SGNH/GDSL hydrolase family protein, partial [Bacteroidaceae bacterium]